METNSYCNLHCIACNRDQLAEQGQRNQKNLSLQELKYILSQVKDCPIDTIKFQILNEPMFHPEYHLLTQTVRDFFPKATVIVATNLQYDIQKTSFLKMLPFVDIVYLSIDGTEEIYEKIRRGASYKKLLRSLSDIDAFVATEDKRKLHINFTLSIENYHELAKVYALKTQYGLASVRINLVQNWSENEINSSEFPEEMITELKKYANDVKGVGDWEYKDCFWPFTGVTIDVYGNVRQCIINTTQEPIGNVYKTPLKKIFNESPVYKNAREMLQNNNPPKNCVTCDYNILSAPLKKIFSELKAESQASARKKVAYAKI